MTSKPIIELKGVKVHLGLSEETPAYTAKLYVDGKHFADVNNSGHGGCDRIDAPRGAEKGFNERLTALDALVKETYPTHECSWEKGKFFDESLEVLCHTAVWVHVDQRNMKSRLSRTIMTFEEGKVYSYKGKKSDERMDALAAKKPEAIILNRLTFSEAWDLTKNAA